MLKHLFLAIFLFASNDLAWSKEPPKAPQIEPKQHTESGLKGQENRGQQTAPSTQPLPGIPEISAEGTDRKGQSKTTDGSEQGTEFWPPLYGYRLKVTDTLLAGITFLLFLATFALWLATRKLVRGSEKTAERQLRAYLLPKGGTISPKMDYAVITFSNNGQTPAYNVLASSAHAVVNFPLSNSAVFSMTDIKRFDDIGAAGERSIEYFFAISSEERDAIINRTKAICFWGSIEYLDIFKSEPRTTEFRFYYGGDFRSSKGSMTIAKEGNKST